MPTYLAELQQSGIRHTPKNIVWITKSFDGKIVFLETGNTRAGLQHILEKHTSNFANKGIPNNIYRTYAQTLHIGARHASPLQIAVQR